jgi:hypothetical protein
MPYFSTIPYHSMVTAFLEHFTSLSIVGSLVFISYMLYSRLTYKPEIPSNLPWIGRESSKHFAEMRATFSSIGNTRKWLAEGYKKVCLESQKTFFCESTELMCAALSIQRRAKATSSHLTRVNLESSSPASQCSGYSNNQIMCFLPRQSTMTCWRVNMLSPILTFSKRLFMSG